MISFLVSKFSRNFQNYGFPKEPLYDFSGHWTPIIVAAQNDYYEAIQILLPYATDEEIEISQSYARNNKNYVIGKFVYN